MKIDDAIGMVKNYAEKYTRSFVDFFRDGTLSLAEGESAYQHIVGGALIYLVLGVTLQDSFISGIKIEDISWLDRALVQLVFWVTIGLVLHLLIWLFGKGRSGAGLVALRVMPIAYLTAAYASVLGAFAAFALRFLGVQIPVPHVFHILVQVAMIAIYMPRELRVHAGQTKLSSRLFSGVIFVIVLLVDFVVVFGSAFLSGPAR
jgi:hypothetical protein